MSRARFAEAAIRHVALGLGAARRGRTARRDHRPQCRSRPAGLARRFIRLQQKGRVVFTATIAGQAYARHGTTIETRLTVIDRVPAEDPRAFPSSPGMAADAAELLDWVSRLVPPRAAGHRRIPPPAPVYSDAASGRAGRKLRRRSSRSSSARRQPRISSSSLTRPATGRRRALA